MSLNPDLPETKIRLLDLNTINQIAAGEVVERPASVVKELVENAIDAEATHISVKILDDDAEKIQVSDNGYGMVPEDLVRSVQSHATSKIRHADDLSSLHTLGFRGEALPSIAAVSRMTVSSRVPGALSGYLIEVENGKPTIPQETGMPEGTTVLVDKLFYNTPARKKFLKSPSQEIGQISDLIGHLALSRPSVAFSLTVQNKKIIATSGNGDINQAFLALYGKETLKSMVEVEWLQNILIYGVVSLPELSRSNRQHYNFFINNRWIRSQELSAAVDEAYHTLLPQHRYPITAIYLSIPPELIDVNVHPAKMEVKFREPKIVRECLIGAIKQALLQRERTVPRLGQLHHRERTSGESVMRIDEKGPLSRWEAAKGELSIHEPQNVNDLEGTLYGKNTAAPPLRPRYNELSFDFKAGATQDHAGAAKNDDPSGEAEGAKDKKGGLFSYRSLRLLGQLNATFIVAVGEDGVYFIDQHAAHERILYERYKAGALVLGGGANMLAVAENLELSYQEKLCLIDNIIALNELGFILEHFGDNTFILRGVPLWYEGTNGIGLMRDLLAMMLDCDAGRLKSNREEELFMMACKSAVKAKQQLTDSDIYEIFRRLDQCENPYTCPHGRPLAVKLTFEEIARKFLR